MDNKSNDEPLPNLISIYDPCIDQYPHQLLCVVCDQRVDPIRGSILRWHFRHHHDTTIIHHGNVNESDYHALGKQFLAQTFYEWTFRCIYGCGKEIRFVKDHHQSQLEYYSNPFRIDVGILCKKNDISTLYAAVEICYTHPIDFNKRRQLQEKTGDHDVIEVEAVDLWHHIQNHQRQIYYRGCQTCCSSRMLHQINMFCTTTTSTTTLSRKRKKSRSNRRRPCDYCHQWMEPFQFTVFPSFSYYLNEDHPRLFDTRAACTKTCISRCYQCMETWISLKWKRMIGPCWRCLTRNLPHVDERTDLTCEVCSFRYDLHHQTTNSIDNDNNDNYHYNINQNRYRQFHFIVPCDNIVPVSICSEHVSICGFCQEYKHAFDFHCHKCELYKDKLLDRALDEMMDHSYVIRHTSNAPFQLCTNKFDKLVNKIGIDMTNDKLVNKIGIDMMNGEVQVLLRIKFHIHLLKWLKQLDFTIMDYQKERKKKKYLKVLILQIIKFQEDMSSMLTTELLSKIINKKSTLFIQTNCGSLLDQIVNVYRSFIEQTPEWKRFTIDHNRNNIDK